jgi:hypothetical protein
MYFFLMGTSIIRFPALLRLFYSSTLGLVGILAVDDVNCWGHLVSHQAAATHWEQPLSRFVACTSFGLVAYANMALSLYLTTTSECDPWGTGHAYSQAVQGRI